MSRFNHCLFFLLYCTVYYAQVADDQSFKLIYANDYFTATDYYFTQGIRMQYTRGDKRYFIAQEGYTPTSIRADRILYGDRPYAGSLYIGYGVGEWQEGEAAGARGCRALGGPQLSWSVTAGVIGPWSLAEAEQKYIHRKTGNIEPKGWQFQIANDLLLNGTLGLRQDLIVARYLTIDARAAVSAGTYRVNGRGSVTARFGLLPSRSSTVSAHVFVAPEFRLVGYDATLQGGIFRGADSPYTLNGHEVNRLVGQITGGAHVGIGKLGLTFSHTYLAPEFTGGRRHAWGTVVIGWYW